jgi:ribosomal subunit interface protein
LPSLLGVVNRARQAGRLQITLLNVFGEDQGRKTVNLKIVVRNHADFSPILEDYLRTRVERLEHFSNQEAFGVEAILSEEGHQKVCELITRLKGKEIFARADAIEFQAAIDEAQQRLKVQLEKYFKKKIDLKRRGL